MELDRTAFFPTGGGQLCDTGILESDGKAYKVVETVKSGEEVLHKLEAADGLRVGATVKGK